MSVTLVIFPLLTIQLFVLSKITFSILEYVQKLTYFPHGPQTWSKTAPNRIEKCHEILRLYLLRNDDLKNFRGYGKICPVLDIIWVKVEFTRFVTHTRDTL